MKFGLWLVATLGLAASAHAKSKFNQSAAYDIQVSTQDWSNYDGDFGGCVTCPYTCITPKEGPDGTTLNLSNQTLMSSLPSIYTQAKANGCCYADKRESTQMPNCQQEASPPDAESCGFLYGPTLKWRIDRANDPPSDNVFATLFASVDCESFWAVGRTAVKYTEKTKSVSGSKQINGGCYGDPEGTSMVLAGCLSSTLKYDKSSTYRWDDLAEKCQGLDGKCVITNGMWGEHLKCCKKESGLVSEWDKTYKLYVKEANPGVSLSGPAVTGIVFGGVALIMLLIHVGAKVRESARQTALMREQEASDDYEEVMTPLTGVAGEKKPAPLQRPIGPSSVDVSLGEGDQIFRKKQDNEELIYEGDM